MIILITTLNEIIDNNIKVPHTDRRFIINTPTTYLQLFDFILLKSLFNVRKLPMAILLQPFSEYLITRKV